MSPDCSCSLVGQRAHFPRPYEERWGLEAIVLFGADESEAGALIFLGHTEGRRAQRPYDERRGEVDAAVFSVIPPGSFGSKIQVAYCANSRRPLRGRPILCTLAVIFPSTLGKRFVTRWRNVRLRSAHGARARRVQTGHFLHRRHSQGIVLSQPLPSPSDQELYSSFICASVACFVGVGPTTSGRCSTSYPRDWLARTWEKERPFQGRDGREIQKATYARMLWR